MKQTYFYIILLYFFSVTLGFSQSINRQEINGQIFFNLDEKDGITVFNLSSIINTKSKNNNYRKRFKKQVY